jgi:hypothetical protein
MPMDKRLYPPDWNTIAHQVKEEAQWQCQQCQKACRRPSESVTAFVERTQVPLAEVQRCPKRWELTVAHLDHIPQNCDRANLRALCTPCHCRYDLSQMWLKKRLKRERQGQLRLEGVL